MNNCYVTFYNGTKILIKPTCKVGRLLYCYHCFNDTYIPTVLDMCTIENINGIKSKKHTRSIDYDMDYLNELNSRNGFIDIPHTFRKYRDGGSELLSDITGTSIINSPNTTLQNQNNSSYGTVVAPIFPDVKSDWFFTGFPIILTIGEVEGKLVDYIPIYFYATKNGNEKFSLPLLPDRLGYLDTDNLFTENLVWDGPFRKGQLLFTLLLNKDDPSCEGSELVDTSYWNLLTEFSNIDAGSGATKSVTLTSGITKDESYSMASSIGSKVVIDAGIEGIGKVSANLSAELSTSFNSKIVISTQITTTDTVEFRPQDRTQRICTYQFVEQYKIKADDPLEEKVNSFNNKEKNYVANFAKAEFTPRTFDYQSRYFAKAFVLDPRM